jgi:hypothetical protein
MPTKSRRVLDSHPIIVIGLNLNVYFYFTGTEVWLSVNSNDLQIQFAHDPSVILYYPIHSLVYCVAVRYATRTEKGDKFPNDWRFVRLDSPEAILMENLPNPPLFTVVLRRTRALPINECHCFIAKSKRIALALVQACFDAYQATDTQQDCSKVPLYFKVKNVKRRLVLFYRFFFRLILIKNLRLKKLIMELVWYQQ